MEMIFGVLGLAILSFNLAILLALYDDLGLVP